MARAYNNKAITHGMSKKIECKSVYIAWVNMRRRCLNPNHPYYKAYGGAGITICSEWDDFVTFYNDMGDKPSPAHSLDRIDNSKGYSKGNCRWATKSEQNDNRHNTIWIEAFGVKKPLAVWSRELGFCPTSIVYRLKNGMTPEEALTKPKRRLTRGRNKEECRGR